MKEISLNFEKYYKYGQIPYDRFAKSGIYCICVGKTKDNKKCSLSKLLYIGESENVSARLSNHERLEDWKKYLDGDNILIVSIALVSKIDRERAEAACIFYYKPPCNEQCTTSFSYEDTEIITTGNKLFEPQFVVKKDSTWK
jgi:hypothetical protein